MGVGGEGTMAWPSGPCRNHSADYRNNNLTQTTVFAHTLPLGDRGPGEGAWPRKQASHQGSHSTCPRVHLPLVAGVMAVPQLLL